MKKAILKVLKGKLDQVDLPYIPPRTIQNYLEGLGAERIEIETNGWEVDFWATYRYEGKTYMFSGSWYEGGYTFSKDAI